MRFMILNLFLVLAALAVCSCSDDFSPGIGPSDPGPQPYQWPDTPGKLMENFERAYGEMNITEYWGVLHDDYEFIFIGNTDTWTREDDIQSTTNMFAGMPGMDPEGEVKAGVLQIAITNLIRQTPWHEVPEDDGEFPDAEYALYNVTMVFTLMNGTSTITVDSDQEFYLMSEEVDQGDGTMRSRYYLRGQRDIANGKPSEQMSWGGLKMLYYEEGEGRGRSGAP